LWKAKPLSADAHAILRLKLTAVTCSLNTFYVDNQGIFKRILLLGQWWGKLIVWSGEGCCHSSQWWLYASRKIFQRSTL